MEDYKKRWAGVFGGGGGGGGGGQMDVDRENVFCVIGN